MPKAPMNRIFIAVFVATLGIATFHAIKPSAPPLERESFFENTHKSAVVTSLKKAVDGNVESNSLTSSSSHTPIVDARSRIWDAADVLAAALAAKASGTADEKDWALEVIRECNVIVFNGAPSFSDEIKSSIDDVAAKDSPDIRSERAKSLVALQARCRGLERMSIKERNALLAEFRAATTSSPFQPSPYQSLKALSQKVSIGDTRFGPDESNVLNNALHGEDPVLRREAFLVVYNAFDRNSPGGNSRRDALLLAMAADIINPPLSKFETLQACAFGGSCARVGMAEGMPGDIPDEVRRLAEAYRAAFANRLSYSQIAAIR